MRYAFIHHTVKTATNGNIDLENIHAYSITEYLQSICQSYISPIKTDKSMFMKKLEEEHNLLVPEKVHAKRLVMIDEV